MKPIWLVRSRQIASKMKFWIALVGYNPRETLWSQAIYLAYVIVFFSLWGFAVLALLADQGAWVLSLFSTEPALTSVRLLTGVLLAVALWRGYRAAQTSPFVFSDDDAVLICQTPLDRKQVALAWMLGDWIINSAVYLALAVVLQFAVIQMREPGGIQWAHLPKYWLAGLRVVSVVLLIHLTLSFLTYAIGALRLWENADRPILRLIPVGFAALFLSLAVVNRSGLALLIWPVEYPLRAGFGDVSWLAGIGVALLLASGGLAVFYYSSSRLNLSRAAQESHSRWAFQQVSWLGDTRLSQQMKLHARLRSGHLPTPIPGRIGIWAVVWKERVTTFRIFDIFAVLPWLGILAASLGMMLPLDWGAQLWAFILWVLLAGQQLSKPVRSDLGHWVITRQLPFQAGDLLAVEIGGPASLTIVLGWLAYGISAWAGHTPQTILLALIPAAVLAIALVAAYDVLRQCRSSHLLAGYVPEMGFGGLLIGVVITSIPLVWVPLLTRLPAQPWLSYLMGMLGWGISLVVVYALWRLCAARFRDIE